MDTLAALSGLWRSVLALGQRRLIVLGVVGASLFAFITASSYLLSRSRFEPLYVGLTASDASRIAAALEEAGIAFDVSSDGARVLVQPANIARARALLAERGLPASASAGYELFDKLGPLGLTSFMQEVTRLRALEGEIGRTILTMQGVRSARVHIVLPEGGSFRRQQQPATASVVLKFQGAPGTAPVQAIRQLISAAVPGLSIDNVRVLGADGAVLTAGADDGLAAPSRMADLERQVARQVQDNIQSTLIPHLGLENFRSSVAVRLNIDKRQVSESVYDPESKVERSVRVTKESDSAQNAAGRANVSVEQNVPGDNSDAGGQAQNQKSKQRRDEVTNYEISSKSTTTVSEGYRVDAIHVAVVLNKKRLVDGDGKALDAEALSRRLQEIERLVSIASGLDDKRGDRITVSALEFSPEAPMAGSEEAGGFSGIVSRYGDSVLNALALIVVGLVVVWFGLRPLARNLAGTVAEPVAGELPNFSTGLPGGLPSGIPDALPGAIDERPAPMLGSGMRNAFEEAEAGATIDNEADTPAGRLNKLVALDQEKSLTVLRRWIRESSTNAA